MEREIRTLALDYVHKTYGLSPGDLDKLTALRKRMAALDMRLLLWVDNVYDDLEGKTVADLDREEKEFELQKQQVAKWERIARLVGIDPDVSRRVGREAMMAFEPGEGETVTVETLLALDRRIYETALEQSRQQSPAHVVQE